MQLRSVAAIFLSTLSACFWFGNVRQSESACETCGATTGGTATGGSTGATTTGANSTGGTTSGTSTGTTGSTGGTSSGSIPSPAAGGCATVVGNADPVAPVIFFTDITTGPSSGGVGGNGVYITIFGLRFGTQGANDKVFIGGQEVAAYTSWNPTDTSDDSTRFRARNLQTITVQPGPGITGANLPLFVYAHGASSNAVNFSATSTGHIYFVDSTYAGGGSDGSVSKPFTSITSAKHGTVQGGDVVYVTGSFTAADSENPAAVFALSSTTAPATTAALPIAYVGYPGSPPTVGGSGTYDFLLGDGSAISHIVVANFIFTGTDEGINFTGTDARFAGNKLFAFLSNGAYPGAAVIGDAQTVSMLGNYFHTHDWAGARAIATLSSADFAWNEFNATTTGVNANGGAMSGLRIFANLFVGNGYNDINIAAGVASAQIFNNVVVDGMAPSFALESDSATVSAPITITNNTVDQSANVLTEDAQSPVGDFTFENNAVLLGGTSNPYTQGMAGGASGFTVADHNFYAPVAGSSSVVSSVETDAAVYTSSVAFDFTSYSTSATSADVTPVSEPAPSPLIDAGVTLTYCGDYFGVLRPQGAGWDAGAVEAP